MKNQATLHYNRKRNTAESKHIKEKTSAFSIGFIVTLLMAALLVFSLTTLYRMENTVAPVKFEVLKIEKKQPDKLEIVVLNEEYFFDIPKSSPINDNLLNYDALIPIEIRTFFTISKAMSDAVANWLGSVF